MFNENFSTPKKGCKRKEEPPPQEHMPSPKKPRLVFTDLQRRTLQAIFKVNILQGVGGEES